MASKAKSVDAGSTPFRFFDNREKYLLFVTTCSEKWEVATRITRELEHLNPAQPALKVFDAGMGDGTVLTRVMRAMHAQFPTVPFLVVGKEVSLEDVRLSVEKLPDRFHEHPQTVFVATNMFYYEAAGLMPRNMDLHSQLNWHTIELDGESTHGFDQQIRDELQPILNEGWQTMTSEKSGNPRYVKPSVVVMYRKDHKFSLDSVIPRPGESDGEYDLVIASQPYQARLPADVKVRNVLGPLSRAIAPGGRMLTIQSTGKDPGMEIIRKVWPKEQPFKTPRHDLLATLKASDYVKGRKLRFLAHPDKQSLFNYGLHVLPNEVASNIGTSTLLAAWNAAVYVAQIEDHRLRDAIADSSYLEATQKAVKRHGGLWFQNESFTVARPPK